MTIWKREISIDALAARRAHTMLETIGIEFLGVDEDSITARMPVDRRTHQPYGILHGGASAALAETLGSIAAEYATGAERVVGTDLHIHHLRQVMEGWVYGTVRPVRIGRRVQVWEIRVRDEAEKLVSMATLTTLVV